MYLTSVAVRGFHDLPRFSTRGLDRVVRVRRTGPQVTALGDAVELAFAALAGERLVELLRRWGVIGTEEQPQIEVGNDARGFRLPEQASWSAGWPARTLVADPDERVLSVEVEALLDPRLAARVRRRISDPELVVALLEQPRISWKVGALFNRAFDAVAVNVDAFSVGGRGLSLCGDERAGWVPGFLNGLAERFVRYDGALDLDRVARRALDAMTSPDRYAAYEAWQHALAPELGKVRAVRGPGGLPCLVAEDLPLRRRGPEVVEQVGLAAMAWLYGADILWVDRVVEGGLDRLVSGPNPPLEQVWQVVADGELILPEPPNGESAPFDWPHGRGSS